MRRSRKPVWAFPSIGGSNPPLSVRPASVFRRVTRSRVSCTVPITDLVTMPSDEQISDQIEQLEHERDALFKREGTEDPTRSTDTARLEEIRVDLDVLWDLLRRRRALREAGQDPDLADERAAETVERYWQ